jgi:ADP-heptose:LPS heptosyltransferase
MKEKCFIINGCFGDVLYATPVLKHLSIKYNQKFYLETDKPSIFKNNPYVKKIFDTSKEEKCNLDNVEFFNCNNYKESPYGGKYLIRNMFMVDFWSTKFGFTLTPEQKTLEYYPDKEFNYPESISLPKNYIVISPSITDSCRTWEEAKWKNLIHQIKSQTDLDIVITGKTIHEDKHSNFTKSTWNLSKLGVIDLTDKLNLPCLWSVINNSKAFITHNSGGLPFAGTTDTNIILLGGAIHPHYRLPYRKGSQSYKQTYISGDCKIHCQSDIKYNVNDKGDLLKSWCKGGFCFERKETFECHPSPDKVFKILMEIIKNSINK